MTNNTQSRIQATMKAMVPEIPGHPLVLKEVPVPSAGQVLVKVIACGVCRTDLHIMDSELAHPKLPLIPGHEIVGRVAALGAAVTTRKPGDLVGIPWVGYTCGYCRYCLRQQENLCENALFTGYTMDGGYAEYVVAYADQGNGTDRSLRLNAAMDNGQKGTESFSQDIEPLKHNFLIRGYFRKQDKQKKKNNITAPAPPLAGN